MASSGANRLLSALALFLVVGYFGSDLALTHSRAFWRFGRTGRLTGPTAPLVFESTLHLLTPGRSDMLFVGSSVVERDVDAPTVARRMGRRVGDVFKLPLLGASSLEVAMLTRRLIELRPKVIVYLATPWALQNHVDWDLVRFYDPVVAWNVFSWSELLADHATHASSLLAASHVIVRHRAYLRTLLFEPLLSHTAEASVHEPGSGEEILRRWAERFATRVEDFGCDNANARGLAWMARRLSQAGIALVVVATPVAGKRDRDPALRRLVDECLSAQARATGFSFLPRKLWGDYPRDHFYDPVHMTSIGRMRFSGDLGRILAERMPVAQTTD